MEDINLNIEKMNNKYCKNCNECCDLTTMITKQEKEKLVKLVLNNKKLMNHIESEINNKIEQANMEICDLKCIFNNNEKRCVIYKHRPFICKSFHCDTNQDVNIDVKKYKYNIFDVVKDIFNQIKLDKESKNNIDLFIEYFQSGINELNFKYAETLLKKMETKEIVK
jgi:Fe-S-cluster containining protein